MYVCLSVVLMTGVCMSECMSVCLCLCLCVYLSVCMSVVLMTGVCMSVCLSVCLSICVCSANDGCLYVYDRQRNERTLRVCILLTSLFEIKANDRRTIKSFNFLGEIGNKFCC